MWDYSKIKEYSATAFPITCVTSPHPIWEEVLTALTKIPIGQKYMLKGWQLLSICLTHNNFIFASRHYLSDYRFNHGGCHMQREDRHRISIFTKETKGPDTRCNRVLCEEGVVYDSLYTSAYLNPVDTHKLNKVFRRIDELSTPRKRTA